MGGECLDDFDRLRADPGLAELLGHRVPSPEAAWQFLSAFHDEPLIEAAKAARGLEEIGSRVAIKPRCAHMKGSGATSRCSRCGRR